MGICLVVLPVMRLMVICLTNLDDSMTYHVVTRTVIFKPSHTSEDQITIYNENGDVVTSFNNNESLDTFLENRPVGTRVTFELVTPTWRHDNELR